MSETFSPIPNFAGVNAGQQFRDAVNNALGGTVPITPMMAGGSITGGTISAANISQAVAAAMVTDAALRTVATRSTDRINFADYQGADPTGNSDNSALIAQALSDARAQQKALFFPSGIWGYANPATVQQGDTIVGDGAATRFLYIGSTTSLGDERAFITPAITGSISPPQSGQPTIFANFRVSGPWNGTSVTTQITTPLIQVHGLWAVEFRDLIGEWSCNLGFMASFCWSVRFVNCRMEHCARDALNASGSSFIQAILNQIHHCDDNAISAHANTAQSWSIVSNVIIAMNTITDSPGISAQGAKRTIITSNIIERARQVGIEVAFIGANLQEGETPPIAVQISGNVITDVINRQNIDGLDIETNYIAIGTLPPQPGTQPAIPGDPAPGTGVVVLPYPYFNVQRASGTDTTTPIPAAWHVEVSGNTCMRTIDPGSAGLMYSSLGYGQMFTRNGWLNPTLNATALLQGIGLHVFSYQNKGTEMRNLRIANNKFHGMEVPVYFSQGMQITGGEVIGNECVDFVTAAFQLPFPALSMRIRFVDNVVDGDPFFERRGTGATNGRWMSGVNTPSAIIPNNCSGIIYERNLHRNIYQVALGGFPTASIVRNNILYCNPVEPGYNAGNEGIGVIPYASAGYAHFIENCDPTSASFGVAQNGPALFATAQPAVGTFVTGQFVWNDAPSVSGGQVLLGWMRLTTGAGNSAGTDWVVVYGSTT